MNAAYVQAAFLLKFVPSTSDSVSDLTAYYLSACLRTVETFLLNFRSCLRRFPGTTKQATLPIIGSFFRNQTFPPNWFRAASPVTGSINGATVSQIMAAIPMVPGRNNAQGVYVADPVPPPPFNSSFVRTPWNSKTMVT